MTSWPSISFGSMVGGLLLAGASAAQAPEWCRVDSVPEDRVECVELRVPVGADRTDSLTVRSVVVRPEAPLDDARPLLLLGGGPGLAGLRNVRAGGGAVARSYPGLPVVFTDLRGTGQSGLLDCPGVERVLETAGESLFDVETLSACAGRLNAERSLDAYGTLPVISDLERLRERLGAESWNLLAVSWGTRIATTYATMHPDRVRAMVLDGPMAAPGVGTSTSAVAAESATRAVLRACDADPECLPGQAAVDLYAAAIETARSGELRVADRSGRLIELSPGAIGYAVRGLLYFSRGHGQLPGALARLARGDASEFGRFYLERRRATHQVALGVYLASTCREEIPFGEGSGDDDDTLLGDFAVASLAEICARLALPPETRRALHAAGADTPTLVLSGEWDPVTPPANAEAVARSFPKAHVVRIPFGGHGAAQSPSPPACVVGVVAAFLADPDRAPDPSCFTSTLPAGFWADPAG